MDGQTRRENEWRSGVGSRWSNMGTDNGEEMRERVRGWGMTSLDGNITGSWWWTPSCEETGARFWRRVDTTQRQLEWKGRDGWVCSLFFQYLVSPFQTLPCCLWLSIGGKIGKNRMNQFHFLKLVADSATLPVHSRRWLRWLWKSERRYSGRRGRPPCEIWRGYGTEEDTVLKRFQDDHQNKNHVLIMIRIQ